MAWLSTRQQSRSCVSWLPDNHGRSVPWRGCHCADSVVRPDAGLTVLVLALGAGLTVLLCLSGCRPEQQQRSQQGSHAPSRHASSHDLPLCVKENHLSCVGCRRPLALGQASAPMGRLIGVRWGDSCTVASGGSATATPTPECIVFGWPGLDTLGNETRYSAQTLGIFVRALSSGSGAQYQGVVQALA